MSINLALLKKLGCDVKSLKAAFTAKKLSKEIDAFKTRMADRIQEAVNGNTSSPDYRVFLAIDRTLDSPFFAQSYSLFTGLLQNKWDSKKVLSTLQEWGMGQWIKRRCGCGGGCTNLNSCTLVEKVADIPTFFEVDFPIALAYKRIRVARLYNDRNLTPLLPYYPLVNTPEERLRCQLLTQRVQIQGQQMNHKAVLRQLIDQSTGYGTCVLFPREAWYADEQPTEETKGTGKKQKRVKRTVKEGIRYEHPHPSRMYYDLAYPAYTLNSDTGCQHAGYWSLVRYGDVMENSEYWNTKDITYGADSFRITDTNRIFFETVYPCTMQFPSCDGERGRTDREERLQTYTRAEKDKALLLTNHFERLNPMRDLGLKNKDGEGYDGDVWFRFNVAANETVIFAEPLAYRPTVWSGYDADANRYRNPSIVLETIPAQDMIHNLFSQAILQAKNNLANVSFVNTDAISDTYIEQIENLGEKVYRRPILIPFSRHESRSMAEEKQDAIIPLQLQRMPINDLLVLVKGILDLLDRTLVMSSQELAADATHEISATESTQKAQSTSTRLTYTGSYIDDAIYAWQVQLHDAGMAHWDDEIFAEVALQEEATDKKALEKLGFKIESLNENDRTAGVRGSKKSLDVTQFTVRRDAADRIKNVQVAAQMVQLFQAFSQNPILIQAIGTGQVVKVFNEIASIAGLPRDFRLTATIDPIKESREFALEDRKMAKEDRDDAKKMAEKQQEAERASGELQKILPQLAQQIQQETIGAVGQQLKPVFEQAAEVDKQQQQQIEQLGQATQQVTQVTAETRQALEKIAQLIGIAQQPPPQEMLQPQLPPGSQMM